MNYKSFRDQCIECKESGNQIEVDVSVLQLKILIGYSRGGKITEVNKILVCLKHNKACSSKVCADERGVKTI